MTSLERLVENVVEGYRSTFRVAAFVAIILTAIHGTLTALFLLGPILVLCYFGGLWLTGQILALIVNKDLLAEEFNSKRIEMINQKLDSGELTFDDPQLAVEMKKAGLRPLSIITEKGPIFGRQFDSNLYEWIDAKEGDAGVGRYLYVGQAVIDENGIVDIQNQDPKNLYLVLDGSLYERVVE